MSNIYQIKQELLSIFDELEENGGELTEELEQRLAVSQEDFKDKIESYTNVIKSLEADINAIKIEQKRLKELADKKDNTINRLKSIIIDAIEMFGDTKRSGVKYLDYGTGQVSIRQTKAVDVDKDVATAITKGIAVMIENLYDNNQIDVVEELDQIDLLKIIASNPVNDISYKLNTADLNSSNVEISLKVPVYDLTNGAAYTALKEIITYTENYSINTLISKTELKERLEENGSCAPHLAKLVINKNVSIK